MTYALLAGPLIKHVEEKVCQVCFKSNESVEVGRSKTERIRRERIRRSQKRERRKRKRKKTRREGEKRNDKKNK